MPERWRSTVDVYATHDGLPPRLALIVFGEPQTILDLIDRLRPDRPIELRDTAVCSAPGEPARNPDADRCIERQAIRWYDLTRREVAVAALVGQAMTNQQIAHRLRISPHTVNYHLRHIFQKLAIRSRVHLAQLAQANDSGAEHGSHPSA